MVPHSAAVEADLVGNSAGVVLQSIFTWPVYVAQVAHSLATGSSSECSKG